MNRWGVTRRSRGAISWRFLLFFHSHQMHRAREEELLYVLTKILGLRLWPGSLWAALSDKPSEYCINQPGDGPPVTDIQSCIYWQRLLNQQLAKIYPYLRLLKSSLRILWSGRPWPTFSTSIRSCAKSRQYHAGAPQRSGSIGPYTRELIRWKWLVEVATRWIFRGRIVALLRTLMRGRWRESAWRRLGGRWAFPDDIPW